MRIKLFENFDNPDENSINEKDSTAKAFESFFDRVSKFANLYKSSMNSHGDDFLRGVDWNKDVKEDMIKALTGIKDNVDKTLELVKQTKPLGTE